MTVAGIAEAAGTSSARWLRLAAQSPHCSEADLMIRRPRIGHQQTALRILFILMTAWVLRMLLMMLPLPRRFKLALTTAIASRIYIRIIPFLLAAIRRAAPVLRRLE